jgi:hypothetical protein
VRKVDGSTGIISTVAGIGKFSVRTTSLYSEGSVGTAGGAEPVTRFSAAGAGYSGDGGPATEAMLNLPSSVALDRQGNLFIADSLVRVRKVDAATGVITTVASSEPVSSYETGKVLVYTTVFGQLVSIGVNDAGDIFLADFNKNLVHKVSAPAVDDAVTFDAGSGRKASNVAGGDDGGGGR